MQSVRRCATLLGRGWARTPRGKTRFDGLTPAPDTAPRPVPVQLDRSGLDTPSLTEICSGVTEGSIKEQDDHRTQLRVNS